MPERRPPPRLAMGQFVLKPNTHFTAWVRVIKTTLLMIRWAEENLWRRIFSTQRWAYYCKLWEACLEDPMFPWRMHIASYETVLERIQEITNDLNSYIMNRATPYLEVWSSLRNNESSNHHGQPRMGTPHAHASELKASTWMSRWIRSTRRLWITNKDTLWQWRVKERGLIFQTR
jgi:hypothetical protein